MNRDDELTIGEVARRTGVAASALRFYEARGLVRPIRTLGNQRRYTRAMLRTISVIKAAQAVGLSLDEIEAALGTLPEDRVASKADWTRLSKQWREGLERRIAIMQRLRDDLDGCISCGCLSLKSCALFNPDDQASAKGPGSKLTRVDRRTRRARTPRSSRDTSVAVSEVSERPPLGRTERGHIRRRR